MSHRQPVARGIGEHLEHVELGTSRVLAGEINLAALPFSLPVGLALLGVVAFVHRRCVQTFKDLKFIVSQISAKPRLRPGGGLAPPEQPSFWGPLLDSLRLHTLFAWQS